MIQYMKCPTTDNKGGAVLRMLRSCLAFSHGRKYINSTVFDAASGLQQLPMRRRGLHNSVGVKGEAALKLPSRRKLSDELQIDPFLEALKVFLNKFSFGSVTYVDLWESLSNTTGVGGRCDICNQSLVETDPKAMIHMENITILRMTSLQQS